MQSPIPQDIGHALAMQNEADYQERMRQSQALIDGAIPEEGQDSQSSNPKQAYDIYQKVTGANAAPTGTAAPLPAASTAPMGGAGGAGSAGSMAGSTAAAELAAGTGAGATVAAPAGIAGAGAGAGAAAGGAGAAGAGAAGAGGAGVGATAVAASPWIAAAAAVAYGAHKLELPQKSIDLGKDMAKGIGKGAKAVGKGVSKLLDIF